MVLDVVFSLLVRVRENKGRKEFREERKKVLRITGKHLNKSNAYEVLVVKTT